MRRKYFDAARAVAALLVVAVHTQQHFIPPYPRLVVLASFGQLGVQLFFVISAFLIFDSLDRLRQANGSLKEFFIHRFLRIAPLYYFAIVANMVMWVFVAPAVGMSDGPDLNYTAFNVLANIFFLHGLVPSANQSIVGGGWSVGAEFLFYFLAPALFLLRGKPLWLILIGIACYPLVYLATRILQPLIGDPAYVNDNGFLYYSILNQLPVFICGAVMFSWRDRLYRLSLPVLVVAWIVPVGAIYYLWTRFFTGSLTFAFVPMLAGISSIFFIILLSKIDEFGWLVQEIGKRSFSMYLWNFPALLITMSGSSALGVELPFFIALPVVATIAFLLSGLTYYAIEKPFINMAKLARSHAISPPGELPVVNQPAD